MENINIKLKSRKVAGLLLPLFCMAVISSCKNEDLNEPGRVPDYSGTRASVDFKATVLEGAVVDPEEPRNLTQTPFNVEAYAYPGNFYIEIWDPYLPDYKEGDTPPTIEPGVDAPKENPQFNTYFVPTGGNGGMLQYKGDVDDTPNWCNIEDDHYFWSWTLPWEDPQPEVAPEPEPDPEPEPEPEPDDSGISRAEPETPETDEEYVPSYMPVTFKLQDTYMKEYTYDTETDEWIPNEGCWQNGKILETFVGAKSGPYNFRANGPEVPLQFRHLVSRISLRKLMFYGSDGTEHDEFQADITFINMPTQFTFYPHPNRTDDDGEIVPETIVQGLNTNAAPIVETDFNSADPNAGITFAFTNPTPLPEDKMPFDEQSDLRDQFYICPEIDFSQVQFKVTLYEVADKYTNRGEYWGDFSNIVFERDPGIDYDNPMDEGNPDSYKDDSKVLHAGEVMYFDMQVRQSGSGGGTIYLNGWTGRTRPSLHYPHKGIYQSGQASDLAGTGMTWPQKFEMYGEGYLDDRETPSTPSYADGHLGVFHQYGDLDVGNRTTFPIDANYVLDGMGYILKFSPTSTSTTTITIGKMIDIYIEINDEMIYIDPEGFIKKYNPSTNTYVDTGYQIDLNSSKASYSIDVKTGKVS